MMMRTILHNLVLKCKKNLQSLFSECKKITLNLVSNHKKQLIATAVIIAALGIQPLIYIIRSPVLIVSDELFDNLYGLERIKRQQRSASIALFRRVLPVVVADGASPDIVSIAVTSAAARPYCVVFPRRYAAAALFYHGEFPEIPNVVLGGLISHYDLPVPNGILCVYGTDRDTDLYRAGVLAGILANTQRTTAAQDEDETPVQQIVAFLQDRDITETQRRLFEAGVQDYSPDTEVGFFNSPEGIPEAEKVSCVVLAESIIESFERIPYVPLILFSWLDPALTSGDVVVMFDDSPWSQVVAAVQMAARRQEEGKIPSKALVFSGKIADNGVSRTLRSSARKPLIYPE